MAAKFNRIKAAAGILLTVAVCMLLPALVQAAGLIADHVITSYSIHYTKLYDIVGDFHNCLSS